MKVPPKRKGNLRLGGLHGNAGASLNESPSEKEGKCKDHEHTGMCELSLNESPSEKEGKYTLT